MLIDYSNNLVNLACSILKYFDAEYSHSTLKEVDELLNEKYKNVVVLLLDGLGVDALRYHLQENSFFLRNMIKEYSTVFPPTTTAATTTMECAFTPFEHGWLGWSLYFSEIDKIVDAFTNNEKDKNTQAAAYHVSNRYIPYRTIYDMIKDAGEANAYSVSHFGSNRIDTLDELTGEIERLCAIDERKYIYGYWEYPDCLMHEYGCYSSIVTENINELEYRIESMCKRLSDTLIIITADHGHTSTEYYVLSKFPKLYSMLKRPTSIEPRATAFYIKEEYTDDFSAEFLKNFGEDFILYSREEVIEKKLFGSGKMHPKFEDFIGDYLAIAIKNKGFVYSGESMQFVSHHAGLTEKEMIIPLISIGKR
jgi:hypothetical protein